MVTRDRSAGDRVAQSVPGRGVERVGRVGGEDAEGVGEPGHREIDLEQVLARGGGELEARPQPVARHQRPDDGRGDAGGAVAARGASVEQLGRVRRRRRVDDGRRGEVGERLRPDGPASALEPPVAPPVAPRPAVPPSPVEVPASAPPVPGPCETERDRPANSHPPVTRQRATIGEAIGNQESLRTGDGMSDLRSPRAGRRMPPD